VWVRVKRTTNSKAVGAVKGLTSNELSGVEGWPPIFTRIVSPTSTSVAVLEGVGFAGFACCFSCFLVHIVLPLCFTFITPARYFSSTCCLARSYLS